MESALKTLFLSLALLGLTGAAPAELTGRLTVRISGLRDQQGHVCLKLFDGSRGFPGQNQDVVQGQCVAIAENPMNITLDGLTYGNYAVALYHDRNEDKVLNRGSLGIPLEGYGFSNNPPVKPAPAEFGEAMFLLAGPQTAIDIVVRYLN